jgi:hypothetical protein
MLAALLCVLCLATIPGALAGLQRRHKAEELTSDTLLLSVKKASLPRHVGEGVFARTFIPSGSIVCEYRGRIVSVDDAAVAQSDKVMGLSIAGADYVILGDNICAIINDASNVLDGPKFDENGDYLPYAGFSNNCEMVGNFGKLFYVSSRDIKKGEELFVYYGR